MAFFGIKKNTKETEAPKKTEVKKIVAKPAKKASVPMTMHSGNSNAPTHTIVRPHITEKTGMLSQNNVYTFEIAKDANKKQVADAIQSIYKVRPTRVSIAQIRGKVKLFRGGIKGKSASGKKAYVYLKEGDKIEFI